jgi:hypothetical protein
MAHSSKNGIFLPQDLSKNQIRQSPHTVSLPFDEDGAYLHYTPNETIAGLEFDYTPEAGMLLVADMSSSILPFLRIKSLNLHLPTKMAHSSKSGIFLPQDLSKFLL